MPGMLLSDLFIKINKPLFNPLSHFLIFLDDFYSIKLIYFALLFL